MSNAKVFMWWFNYNIVFYSLHYIKCSSSFCNLGTFCNSGVIFLFCKSQRIYFHLLYSLFISLHFSFPYFILVLLNSINTIFLKPRVNIKRLHYRRIERKNKKKNQLIIISLKHNIYEKVTFKWNKKKSIKKNLYKYIEREPLIHISSFSLFDLQPIQKYGQ